MPNPTPQTISNDIHGKLRALFAKSPTYLAPDSREVVELSRELEKLASKDAGEASCLKARLATLMGDLDGGEYWLKNARKLHAAREQIETAECTMYMNLGYFSRSMDSYSWLANPENGWATTVFDAVLANGAHHFLNDMYEKAVNMGVVGLKPLASIVPEAVAIMDLWGDSDADYMAALDVAGEVMRKHRLLAKLSGLTASVMRPKNGEFPVLKMSLVVDVDFSTALDMTIEFVESLALSSLKIPQSMSFEFVDAEGEQSGLKSPVKSIARIEVVK